MSLKSFIQKHPNTAMFSLAIVLFAFALFASDLYYMGMEYIFFFIKKKE